MQITTLYGKEGADTAVGTAVVVDVFRAATTAAYALGGGATYIIPVAHRSEAFALKEANPGCVVTGEYKGIKVEGFDYGNSPYDISRADLAGKIVVQRTSAGTQGLVRSASADAVYFGGFPTFSATARAVLAHNPEVVSIIAMDGEGSEDDIYARCLSMVLQGQSPDWAEARKGLASHLNAQRFFNPEKIHSPREDFDLCTTVDAFPFAIRLTREGESLRLVKETI